MTAPKSQSGSQKARKLEICPDGQMIDIAALRALTSDSDTPCAVLSGRAMKRLLFELDRIPALEAQLAAKRYGDRTVDVVVAGIIR